MEKLFKTQLNVLKVSEKAKLPVYSTDGAAGMDICACVDAPITIKTGERVLVPTGIAIGIQSKCYAALIYPRSGLAVKNGITLSNCVGVIDSDYRGEIKVGLINQGSDDFVINDGDRIAQIVITPVVTADIQEVTSLDETQRGEGGFGSTGIK